MMIFRPCRLSLAIASLLLMNSAWGQEYHIQFTVDGLTPSTNYAEDAFLFRHIRHDSEGWADIVIAQTTSEHNITDEVTYRQAAQDAGLEAYYTQETSWRCAGQDFGPDIVPEVEAGCGGSGDQRYHNYLLVAMPDVSEDNLLFAVRRADREYGVYGNGHWVQDCPIDVSALSIGETSAEDLITNSSTTCVRDYTTYLNVGAGAWIMGVDPSTDNH